MTCKSPGCSTFLQTFSGTLKEKNYLFLIGRYLLYNIVWVSAIHQHESAIDICMSLPSWSSLQPPSLSHASALSQSTWPELSASYRQLSLATCFTCGNVRVSVLLSQLIPPSPPPLYPQGCSVCVSTVALQIGSSVPSSCINKWYLSFSFWLASLV